MVEYHHRKPDGCEWISTYDAGGRALKTETRLATGSVSTTVYHYDQDGRLQRTAAQAGDGAETALQTLTYDDQHNTKTQVFHSVPAQHNLALLFSVEGTDAAFAAPGTTSVTTLYDDHDRPAETLFRDAEQRVLSRVILRYDDAGRLVEETQSTETEVALPPDMNAG